MSDLRSLVSKVSVCGVLGVLMFSVDGRAQDVANGPMSSMGPMKPDSRASMSHEAPRSPDNGVGLSNHNLSINGDEFAPLDSTFGYSYTFVNGSYIRYATSGAPSFFHASFDLPSGAVLDQVSMEIYDNSASSDINFFLFQCNGGTALSGCANLGSAGSSGASTGGTYITISGLNTIIDNLNNSYFIEINAGSDHTGNLGWRRASIYYHLQVSPAPGASDFLDVPTSSPQFQFIEALFNAGITAGCGSGNYCPNQPVTRGQMAVFLSKALGLWWPN
jgi:hypothetical protein